MFFFRNILRIMRNFLYIKFRFGQDSYISSSVYFNKKTILEGSNFIHMNVNIINSKVGYATYIGSNCTLPSTIIGSYCSIAQDVTILPYTHPTHTFVSTHPAFFSLLKQAGFTYTKEQLFQEELFYDSKQSIYVKIGNDVWIGQGVKILGGVEIGDGAIIATGAIVTKSVPAYAIVAGIPAKIIKYRFNDEQINFLLNLKWWSKNKSWIESNAQYFNDIESFYSMVLKKAHDLS